METSSTSSAAAGLDVDSQISTMRQATMDSIKLQNFSTEMQTLQTGAKTVNDSKAGTNEATQESSNGLASGIKSNAQQFGRLLG